MARNWPNNSANRLKVGGNPSVLQLTTGHFTLSCWVKLNSINVNGNNTFISKYNGSQGPLFRITDQGTKNKLSFFMIDNGNTAGHDAIGATALTTGVWQHYVATWNGNTTSTVATLACWLNGVRDGSTTAPGMSSLSDVTDGWTFGARSAPSNPLDGDMCDVAFYNEDLSAGTSTSPEIVALAAGASPFLVRPNKLVGYWPTWGSFDNQVDYSPNKNNLTLVGTLNSSNHAPRGPSVLGV